MMRFLKKLRAGLHRREVRARAARVRYPACGYEAAWPAPRAAVVLSRVRGAGSR
jgi:hypothetical protein